MPPTVHVVPGSPECPDIYIKVHPNRCLSLLTQSSVKVNRLLIHPYRMTNELQHDKWRHELEHDAESVFWLLLYWSMVVQPEECAEERIDAGSWGNLNGNHKSRHLLIQAVSQPEIMADNLIHSFYEPLRPLINDLATVFVVDSHWLPASDPRKDPYYITEAF